MRHRFRERLAPGRLRRAAARGPRRERAGFTLIEILAVILIIGVLVAALVPMVTDAIDAAKVTACQGNLGELYKAITIYQIKYEELPRESGARFFAQLWSRKAMENTEGNAERLTCPAVDRGYLEIGSLPWQEWWSDLEAVDGTYSAYAGRDVAHHPIKRLGGGEALIADDNDGAMNHPTGTNVLWGDGSVRTIEVELLREEGVLGPDEELIVGPESPVEALRALSLD